MSEETEDKVPETGETTNSVPVNSEGAASAPKDEATQENQPASTPEANEPLEGQATQPNAPEGEAATTPEAQGGNTINVLEGLEPVRLRPGMYIGDVNFNGLHQLVYEVVDNSIDEALAGYCKHIQVTIGLDNSITVEDDGRGIPVSMHTTKHKPQCEIALTMLHAGGKFNNSVYKFSGGLHGVGVSCVNALSIWLTLTIVRDGHKYRMRFSRGKTTEQLQDLGECQGNGTTVQFLPDPDIFEVLTYSYDTLARRLRELAYLNAGVRITLTDVRGEPRSEQFFFEGGVPEFVTYLNKDKLEISGENGKKLPPPPPVISFGGRTSKFRSDGTGDFYYDVAFQYNYSYNELIYSFVNGINTKDGGTHLSGFITALTTAINNYSKKIEEEEAMKKGGKAALAAKQAKEKKAAEKDGKAAEKETITSEDVRKGLSAVVSVKVENPLFESQTKTRLNNPEINGLMRSATTNNIKAYFEEHPAEARWIIDHVSRAAAARRAASEAISRTMNSSEDNIAHLLGKLSDCSCKDPSQCELYIVEGDSAGGSAKSGRESAYQAILPIRGKLINAEKAATEKLLRNEEIRTLCTAIGAGQHFGGDDESHVDLSKARYHRVVIMTDADVDGSHIRTLVLTFFFRHMRPLVEAGYIYVARPPLFKVTKGKHEEYVETEDDMSSKLTNFGMQNLQIRLPGAEAFPPEQISSLIQTVRDCLRLCDTNLPRYGIHAADFLELRKSHGTFPTYMVEIRDKGVLTTSYAWSSQEAEQMLAEANAKRAARLQAEAAEKAAEKAENGDEEPQEEQEEAPAVEEPVAEVQYDEDGNAIVATAAPTTRTADDNRSIYLPEAVALESYANQLAEKGLFIANLYDNEAPIIELVDDKGQGVTSVNSLSALCDAITARGRKGLTIQRYKGLGEMSPDELWETTMDPERRSMIRVTVEDAARADETFSMLMGDDVGRRRNFIEENADRVLNPDI